MAGNAELLDSTLLEYRLLGTAEVRFEDRVLFDLNGLNTKDKIVLGVLLLRRGKSTRTRDLAALLNTSPSVVYNCVDSLRKTFRDAGFKSPIVNGNGGYSLSIGPGKLDTDRFLNLVRSADSAADRDDPRTAWANLGEALALWNGDEVAPGLDLSQLPGSMESRLTTTRREARENWSGIGIELKRYSRVVGTLRLLADEDSLNESIYEMLITALFYHRGKAAALAAYEEILSRLAEENLVPRASLRRLLKWISEQD